MSRNEKGTMSRIILITWLSMDRHVTVECHVTTALLTCCFEKVGSVWSTSIGTASYIILKMQIKLD